MTHCSRPACVQFRGRPTAAMQEDPISGAPLGLARFELLTLFTDPDSYKPILEAHPKLRICLAHFGGAGDWNRYLQHPWDGDRATESWLAKILDMIRSGDYPNLWTDISYTVFADDEYVYLLKVLLSTHGSPNESSSAPTSTSLRAPSLRNGTARSASAQSSAKSCSPRSHATTQSATSAKPHSHQRGIIDGYIVLD